MNCLVLVTESDVEVSEEARLPKESERHIIPCMRVEDVRRELNSMKFQARSVEVCQNRAADAGKQSFFPFVQVFAQPSDDPARESALVGS